MSTEYDSWMDLAKEHREKLDDALADNDEKNILYYRGKYLFALRQAYKVNKVGLVDPSVSGLSTATSVDTVVRNVYKDHAEFINKRIIENKVHASIKEPTLAREFGLKMRRLACHVSQACFPHRAATKKQLGKEIAKDVGSLVGSVAKTPFMLTARVISTVGPLAIGIASFPFRLLSGFFTSTASSIFGIGDASNAFDNKVIKTVTTGLGNAIKFVGDKTYGWVGRDFRKG